MQVTMITRTTYEIQMNDDDIVVMDFVTKEIEVTPPDMMCLVITKLMNQMAEYFLKDNIQ